MNDARKKADRLSQIEALLLMHPEGLAQAEIARRLGVHRSTINRYLPSLSKCIYIDEADGGKWKIDRGAYLVNVRFNLHEATAVHLAARLLATRMDRQNPHAAAALRKLGVSLEKLAPHVSRHLGQAAEMMDSDARRHDPNFLRTLEQLTLAWASGYKLRVWHRDPKSGQVFDYRFSPYFIEPYAVGQAVHVMGFREPPGALRTFKVERIERVEPLRETYQIPADFNPTELLSDAWGIWYTEGEPVEVVLRFSPRVAGRVGESRWHRSEAVTPLEDGGLLWKASIAAWREMLPWVRGWGADVEVIEPEEMREEIVEQIAEMSQIYRLKKVEPSMQFWAKYAKNDQSKWHPLVWHMLDSAAVTQSLWDDSLSDSYKSSLASFFNLSIEDMGGLVSFWVALHDIGKAGPEFQSKNARRREYLKQMGFNFPEKTLRVPGFHGTATTLILKKLFSEVKPELPRKFRINLAITLGGHHGEFPENNELNMQIVYNAHVGDQSWQDSQRSIYAALASLLNAPIPDMFPEDNAAVNTVLMLIAGLTTTADWIASNEQFFPYCGSSLSPESYYEKAKQQAREALSTVGWYGWKSKAEEIPFETLFPKLIPNSVQQAIIEICPRLKSPYLIIIEAPTGSGKTEAALYLADTTIQRDHKAGIYIAMPTQATSNQMYDRTSDFLVHRYPQERLNLHLVHGAAFLNKKGIEFTPSNIWDKEELEESNIHSEAWFLPRKRTLLAPFGVGTVDQTFLSVLKSRHFFLRLFGLSHKVLIFDEVHAYDVYMSEIFKTLLHWLRAVGTSVVILSATLPGQTRDELLTAYGAGSVIQSPLDFPRITGVTLDEVIQLPVLWDKTQKVNIEWIEPDEEGIAAHVQVLLSKGGCAAVICNTINRAQKIYQAFTRVYADEPVEIILFHSRFPYLWREEIEDKIRSRFGKDTSQRPQKAIVIATQVIEQSLDLDFDLMVTELAPVDLLIQRIGRLHRHQDKENPPQRPQTLEKPTCIISSPSQSEPDTVQEFGADRFIYEPYMLFRTWFALQNRLSLRLPEDTDELIREVYSQEKPDQISEKLWQSLQSHLSDMVKSQNQSAQNAHNYLIPSSEKTFLGRLKSSFSDDPASISQTVLKAPTREIDPSVQIVCFLKFQNEVHILENNQPIDLDTRLSSREELLCQRASVTLTNRKVLGYFYQRISEIPAAFRLSPRLHGHFPVIFEDNKFETEQFQLILDPVLGVQIVIQ